MTEYHIKTQTGKDDPLSVEKLQKKKIKSDTKTSDNGSESMPSGTIPPVSPKLNGAYNPGTKTVKEPSSKSKISLLQYTALVLLVLNGAVYYYKQQNPPEDKTLNISAAAEEITPAPVKRVAVEQKPQNVTASAATAADSTVKADTTIRIRNNWAAFIKAVPSDFKHYKRGGIYQLKAIVQNQTAFPLDTVKLAVNYIRRGLTFKTEFLTLVNIPEHGEVSVPAPDSRGGTAVKVDVREIRSQKMEFFYNAGLQAEGKADPYFRL